mgnify:CR=1 FL=1
MKSSTRRGFIAAGATGAAGQNGTSGANGAPGANGKSCAVKANSDGSATIACEDGTTVTLRPIRPSDAGIEQAFVRELSSTALGGRAAGPQQHPDGVDLGGRDVLDGERGRGTGPDRPPLEAGRTADDGRVIGEGAVEVLRKAAIAVLGEPVFVAKARADFLDRFADRTLCLRLAPGSCTEECQRSHHQL